MSIKIKTRRFIARHFSPIVEVIYKVRIGTKSFKKSPIIVLTPGKVGSSSIYKTLKNKTKHPVYHIHRYSPGGIEKMTKIFLDSQRKSKPLHLIISKLLRKKLKNYNNDVFLITIVREPISRIISSFFQNTEMYKNEVEGKKMEIDLQKSKALLLEIFQTDICAIVEDWFDKEIKGNFNIDVFASEYDIAKKYDILHNNNYHLLLLKMEDLDEVFPNAIQEFLNIDEPLYIENTNVGENKHYAETYQTIKKTLKLTPQVIDQIINSKYFQHFYKNIESNTIKKWSKKQNI